MLLSKIKLIKTLKLQTRGIYTTYALVSSNFGLQ
jgi:hypothetical protein